MKSDNIIIIIILGKKFYTDYIYIIIKLQRRGKVVWDNMKKGKRRETVGDVTHTHTRHFYGIIGLLSLIFAMIIIFAINLKTSNTYAEEVIIDGLKYTYTTQKDELKITGTGVITNSWQTSIELSKYVNSIENVVINSSENISIADSAFKDCIGLKNIIISENCTTVSETAFEGCIALETLTVIRDSKENLEYTYKQGTWVEKKESISAVNSEEEIEEQEEKQVNAVEQTTREASITKTLNESEKTWKVPESGIYKIELWGKNGGAAKECEGGSRKLLGMYGAKVTGYIELSKDDDIEIKFYEGGAKSGLLTINNDYSSQAGAGGKGIGIYRNSSATPFGAAGRRRRSFEYSNA